MKAETEADIDDAATIARHQVAQRGMTEPERRQDVQLVHLFLLVIGSIPKQAAAAETGIVDKQREIWLGFDTLSDAIEVVLFREVGNQNIDVGAVLG